MGSSALSEMQNTRSRPSHLTTGPGLQGLRPLGLARGHHTPITQGGRGVARDRRLWVRQVCGGWVFLTNDHGARHGMARGGQVGGKASWQLMRMVPPTPFVKPHRMS